MAFPAPTPVQYRDLVQTISAVTAVALTPAPATITTGTTSTATVTVPGCNPGDSVDVNCQVTLNGSVILQGEVTAANTVTVKWANTSAGSVIPTAGALYNVVTYQRNPLVFT